MSFELQTTTIIETTEANTFGTGGKITGYRVATMRVTGADRHHVQTHKISADLSAVSIAIAPLATDASTASGAVLIFLSDKKVDLRVGAASHTALSSVQQLIMGATISALFVTTGSQVTTIRTEIAGGSTATITASKPIS